MRLFDFTRFWRRVTSQVTCFEYADQLLPREDPDAAKCLEGALLEDGLDIRLGSFGQHGMPRLLDLRPRCRFTQCCWQKCVEFLLVFFLP